MSIKPFQKLEMHEFYRQDYERIQMASRMASVIHRDEMDIRAGGNEVEIAVRDFFKTKLSPKYHVSDGHIIDKNLNVSQQLDIIISDAIKNPVFDTHADGSELVFYDSVYSFGEVKKSYYASDILQKFSENILRFKSLMERDAINANVLECANDLLTIKQPLVSNPQRNMLFTFLFIVKHDGINCDQIKAELNSMDNTVAPNIVVVLDTGIYVNVRISSLIEKNAPVINLYPKQEEDQEWKLLTFDDPTGVLNYTQLILQEHLRTTLVKAPDFLQYSGYIFKVYDSHIV